MKIYIPQPGDIFSVLIGVIDLYNDILRLWIFEHKGYLLLEPDRIFCQMKLNTGPFNLKDAFPAISIIKRFDHLFKTGKSRAQRPEGSVSSQRIVDIVRSTYGGSQMQLVYIKRIKFVRKLNMLRRIIRIDVYKRQTGDTKSTATGIISHPPEDACNQNSGRKVLTGTITIQTAVWPVI